MMLLVALAVLAQDPAVGAAGWEADLRYLVSTIKTVHPRPFHRVTEKQFDSAARSFQARLPRLSDRQAALGLMRLVSLVNDGHTALDAAGPVFTRRTWYPVRIDRLADGYFVIATSPAHRELLGARVTALGNRAIETVWDSVLSLAPGDNVFSRMTRVPYWMMMPEMMAALGLSTPERLTLDVEVEGARRSVSVDATPGNFSIWMMYRDRVAGDSTVTLPDASGDDADLPFRHRNQAYWYTVDSGVLYAQVNLVSDADHAVRLDRDTARVSLREFGSRVLARLDSGDVETVVLDLRNNPGGNNGLIQAFVHGLESRTKINSRGHLFVITGRRTYSAAMNFTSLLEERTAAIFVGEPPGGAPSHYGDATSFTLPNSKLTFNVSTLHWDLGVAPTDVREVHEPELPAPPTIEALRSGRDPAIAAIRAWKPGGLLRERLLERYRSGGVDSALALVRTEATAPGLWPSQVEEMIAFGYSLYGVRAPGPDMRRVFEAITDIYPDSHYGWFHLGRLHQFSGRPREAADAFGRALRLRPSNDLIGRFSQAATRQAAQAPKMN
jgi:hypothetical protein